MNPAIQYDDCTIADSRPPLDPYLIFLLVLAVVLTIGANQ